MRGGDVLGLVGESGCGKTTTALALLGHARRGARLAGGRVVVGGSDVLQLSDRGRRAARGRAIAYVPQDPATALNPRHRVGRQLVEALTIHGVSRAEAHARVDELLPRVGITDVGSYLERYPWQLSGGQQQRIAIAMALAPRPAVVVLDEPTTGLDVTTQARVLELLRELRSERGTAFVYVTHDLAVVDSLADRVAVMYAGRIVEAGSVSDSLGRSAHPYTTMLVAAVPHLAGNRALVAIAGAAPTPEARPGGCAFAPRCPLRIERCTHETPALLRVATGHEAACFRLDELDLGSLPPRQGRPEAHRSEHALLEVDALGAAYDGNTVLDGVSLELGRGECVAVVGESGSGKSTLVRCIVGLHSPSAGAIRLRGDILAPHARERTREQRRAIQIVFQNPDRSLNPSHDVATTLARPLRLFGTPRGQLDARIAGLLERVRLPSGKRSAYPRELSGGEKQRVAIARALAAAPEVLLCDEVTSALDVSIQAAVIELLGQLRGDGLSLLFITHNLPLVSSIADRVVVLKDGSVCERGAVADVLARSQHPYTRDLVRAAPELRRPAARVRTGSA